MNNYNTVEFDYTFSLVDGDVDKLFEIEESYDYFNLSYEGRVEAFHNMIAEYK